MKRLDNWSCTWASENPFCAPESRGTSLVGTLENGKTVKTSSVQKVEGRKITTNSGTVYVLGKIDPEYRKFLREHQPDWDWREPLRRT